MFMNSPSLFYIFKRTIILLFMVGFVFVSVYVPQSHTPKANAQAIVNDPAQVIQNERSFFEQIWDGITQTSILGNSLSSLGLSTAQWSVTNTLNGLAWAAAKSTISMIQRSIVRWINSGFQGSPAFIQDLGGFLTNIADETMGTFISELGGPLSIVCSPFRLNVQIAVSSAYGQSRDANARRCTLSGALQNIQNFIGGDMSQGGWPAWFQISQSPSSYTPYGSALNASIEAGIRITNAQGQQVNVLNWGSGFMSSKVCNNVQGASGAEQKCSISTPGTVIANQLNSALGLGHDSLVAADQINEIIGALMQQLVTQVLTGAGGLLGAGGAQGSNAQYTNPTFNVDNYSAGMELQATSNGRELIVKAITTETQYLNIAKDVVKRYEASYTTDPNVQNRADTVYNEARAQIPRIQNNLTQLQALLSKYDAVNEQEKNNTLNEYVSIATTLSVADTITAQANRWYAGIAGMQPREDFATERNAIAESLAVEREYQILVQGVISAYESRSNTTRDEDAAYREANNLLPDIQNLIIDLQDYLRDFDSAGSPEERRLLLSDFNEVIKPDLHTAQEVDEAAVKWEFIFGTLP